MKRTQYKGFSSNHTIRNVYNSEKKQFELNQDRFNCGRSRCSICHPHKKTNRGKVKHKKNNSIFYM